MTITTRRSILAALPAIAAAPALAQNPQAHHSGPLECVRETDRKAGSPPLAALDRG